MTEPSAPSINQLLPSDRPVHHWYRFVLSFPPHLVRTYLERFDVTPGKCVLDPFAGTGTTLVECKKRGVDYIGLEPSPVVHFASRVKTDWSVEPARLLEQAQRIASIADESASAQPTRQTLPPETMKLLLKKSISDLPLHRTLILRDLIRQKASHDTRDYLFLALAKSLPTHIGNLHFGPEVGVGKQKTDVPVVEEWFRAVREIVHDLEHLPGDTFGKGQVHQADARTLQHNVAPQSVDAVITSPPYPNEKDYTRTTRLESVILGYLKDRDDLRALKRTLLRSNTRCVYKGDDDDHFIADHADINALAETIEARRIELGKTSGFERLYARVTRLYFGGMFRHLLELRHVLRPGAQIALVVGDQASFFRVLIRTGQILAELAERAGYRVQSIDLFRTRLSTATREQLREEVVVLQWMGFA